MSKRVHELAKELDRTNKEVIAALAEKNVEVKSHMSVLSEEQEAMVKKALAPKKEQAETKEAAARPEGEAGKQEGAPAAPPKKKKIIAVYNAHNSQTGIKDPRGERKQGNRSQQSRPAAGSSRPAAARPAAGANTAARTGAAQNGAQQDHLRDAHLPLEQQNQINHTDENGRKADGRIDDVVGLAEGGDDADQQADADRADSGENLVHPAAFLKLLKEDGGQSRDRKGGGENSQIGCNGSGDSGSVDSCKGSTV